MAELRDKDLEQANGGVGWHDNWEDDNKLPTDAGNYKLPSDVNVNDIYIPLPSDEKLK